MAKFVKYALFFVIIVTIILFNIGNAQDIEDVQDTKNAQNVQDRENTQNRENHAAIIDFGDPNTPYLKIRLKQLTKDSRAKELVTITQFGDSHTAADFFTGELRNLLQKKYGDAGIGWITPLSVKGQHHTAVKWKFSNWELFNSMITSPEQVEFDFPMGGFIAKPNSIKQIQSNLPETKEEIEIIPNTLDNHLWEVKVQLKIQNSHARQLRLYDANYNQVNLNYKTQQEKWQMASAKLTMPLYIEAFDDVELGSMWLIRDKPSGVVVSAIAANGAKQSIWHKWNQSWFDELLESQSDLVILAYGVNESFDPALDLSQYRFDLVNNIRKIRQILPTASILLISPPDTMINENQAPQHFPAIKAIQYEVAKSEKTLFWDWQQAMGGEFVIKQWLKEGLARSDLIHQTIKGYQKSAQMFYNDFIEFIEKR